MAIEIVDFPIKDGGSFHSFLYVYQRVALMWYLGVSENGVRCDTVHPNWLACCEHAGDGPMMGMDGDGCPKKDMASHLVYHVYPLVICYIAVGNF